MTKKAVSTSSKDRKSTDPMDVHVGARLRLRREALNITQTQLGEILGITFQQVQKYERGANRISASRLFHLSQILETRVEFFFEDFKNASSNKAKDLPLKKKEDFTWLG